MPSITLVWKPITLTAGINYHAFLLYDDGAGNTYYYRGGGSGGTIKIDSGLYRIGTPDFPDTLTPQATLNSWPKQTVISGDFSTVSQVWDSMAPKQVARIERSEIRGLSFASRARRYRSPNLP